MTIYIDIAMLIIEEISWMSKSGYNDRELLEYIDKHYDEIECELNGNEYKEPKNVIITFAWAGKSRKIIDYQKSTLVCTNCGLCEYYPVYVTSYNHTMQPSRRKCFYKRSDNFKVILNKFFYGGNQFVPYDVMEAIRNEMQSYLTEMLDYSLERLKQ